MLPRFALPLGETPRFPDLELEALADEDGRIRDPGIGAELFGQDDPPVRIDFQDPALAVKGGGEALVVFRKGGEYGKPVGDRLLEPGAAAVYRRTVQRGVAVEAVLALARQHRPERRRDRNAPLVVEA